MEQHYAFIKNGKVANVAVFAEQNEELADMVAHEQGYDDAVWVGENVPTKYSTYDGTYFIPPTLDYLYEIGISEVNQEMHENNIISHNLKLEQELLEIEQKKNAKAELLEALNLSPEIIEILTK